jgi:S-DNA-T family DNA segregation ATPase FtsK/SpoIIIE
MQGVVRQRWLFRTGDPLELTVVGLRPGEVPELGPGRAIVADTGREVQVARPAAGLAGAVASVAAAEGPAGARPPQRIGALPREVDPADLVAAAQLATEPWLLPVGIASATLAPAVLALHEGEHALVAGPARSGRSSVLAAIATVVRAARPDVEVVEHRPGSDLGRLAGGSGPVLVLVDGADRVDDADGALTSLLARRRPGLHVVAAGRNDALRSAYGHWTRLVRASRVALLLQPDVDLDGDLAGTTLPRRSIVALGPGRGYLVVAGAIDVVQIAGLHGTD